MNRSRSLYEDPRDDRAIDALEDAVPEIAIEVLTTVQISSIAPFSRATPIA